MGPIFRALLSCSQACVDQVDPISRFRSETMTHVVNSQIRCPLTLEPAPSVFDGFSNWTTSHPVAIAAVTSQTASPASGPVGGTLICSSGHGAIPEASIALGMNHTSSAFGSVHPRPSLWWQRWGLAVGSTTCLRRYKAKSNIRIWELTDR